MSRNKRSKHRIRCVAERAYSAAVSQGYLRLPEELEERYEASLEHDFRCAIIRAFEDQRRERGGGVAT